MSAKVDAILSNWEPTETSEMSFHEFYHGCLLDTTVETLCAGINHMAAFLVFRENGRDLYPLLRKAHENPSIRKLEEVRLELMMRLGASYVGFRRFCDGWLRVERSCGPAAVARVYQEVLAGRTDPASGQIISMWPEEGT